MWYSFKFKCYCPFYVKLANHMQKVDFNNQLATQIVRKTIIYHDFYIPPAHMTGIFSFSAKVKTCHLLTFMYMKMQIRGCGKTFFEIQFWLFIMYATHTLYFQIIYNLTWRRKLHECDCYVYTVTPVLKTTSTNRPHVFQDHYHGVTKYQIQCIWTCD